jgi:hypothetical protein
MFLPGENNTAAVLSKRQSYTVFVQAYFNICVSDRILEVTRISVDSSTSRI